MVIPAEMLTAGASALIGGVLKLMAKKQEIARLDLLTRSKAAREAHDSAAKRWAPAFARRFIAVFATLYFFLIPALCAWKGYPVSFLYPKEGVNLLWGIFSSSNEMTAIQMNGLVFLPIHSHALAGIIGFFFGSEVSK